MFFKIVVLKSFATFTGKHLSLFKKVTGLMATLSKKDSNTGTFLLI